MYYIKDIEDIYNKNNQHMNKEFIRMQKLAGLVTENQVPSGIAEFLDDMLNTSIPEDSEEGETVEGVWEAEEYGDEEAYGDMANIFNEVHSYIESQGGTIIVPGNPDVTYTSMPDGDIGYSLVVTLS